MSEVDFDQLAEALNRATATTTAAECHGTLCGMYCVSNAACEQAWVNQTLENTEPHNAFVGECRDVLLSLYTGTRNSLEGPDLDFHPLLPDDSCSLDFRTQCLAHWCQGFLYGIALQGITDVKSLPADVSEVMTDFAEITRADFDTTDDLEDSEQAYADVTEFVRVGVQLVLENLSPRVPSASKLH